MNNQSQPKVMKIFSPAIQRVFMFIIVAILMYQFVAISNSISAMSEIIENGAAVDATVEEARYGGFLSGYRNYLHFTFVADGTEHRVELPLRAAVKLPEASEDGLIHVEIHYDFEAEGQVAYQPALDSMNSSRWLMIALIFAGAMLLFTQMRRRAA